MGGWGVGCVPITYQLGQAHLSSCGRRTPNGANLSISHCELWITDTAYTYVFVGACAVPVKSRNTSNVEVSMVYVSAIPHRVGLNVINVCVANKNKLICDRFFLFAFLVVASELSCVVYMAHGFGSTSYIADFEKFLWETLANATSGEPVAVVGQHMESSRNNKWYVSILWWRPRDTIAHLKLEPRLQGELDGRMGVFNFRSSTY